MPRRAPLADSGRSFLLTLPAASSPHRQKDSSRPVGPSRPGGGTDAPFANFSAARRRSDRTWSTEKINALGESSTARLSTAGDLGFPPVRPHPVHNGHPRCPQSTSGLATTDPQRHPQPDRTRSRTRPPHTPAGHNSADDWGPNCGQLRHWCGSAKPARKLSTTRLLHPPITARAHPHRQPPSDQPKGPLSPQPTAPTTAAVVLSSRREKEKRSRGRWTGGQLANRRPRTGPTRMTGLFEKLYGGTPALADRSLSGSRYRWEGGAARNADQAVPRVQPKFSGHQRNRG